MLSSAPAGQNGRLAPEEAATAQVLADLGQALRKGKATPDEYRAAMTASRAQHGDDRHEIVKWHAIHIAPKA